MAKFEKPAPPAASNDEITKITEVIKASEIFKENELLSQMISGDSWGDDSELLGALITKLGDLKNQAPPAIQFLFELKKGFPEKTASKAALAQLIAAHKGSEGALKGLKASIAHSHGVGAAVIGFGDYLGVGIDFEHATRSLTERTASRVIARVVDSNEKNLGLSFLQLWTIKEACFKANPETKKGDGVHAGDASSGVSWDHFVKSWDLTKMRGWAQSRKHPAFEFSVELITTQEWVVAVAVCTRLRS